jgi:hypothetical protein
MATALARDFKEFLKSFNLNRVEYLLIGGYAVGIYGYVRATNDLDIWVGTSPENAARLNGASRVRVRHARAELRLVSCPE